MHHLTVAALLVAGLIHLLPVPGVLGAGTLARLYGIEVPDPNTAILLQHRALLFGILGVLMLAAIPFPSLRGVALWVGLASAASFVVVADVVAAVALMAGLVAQRLAR